MIFYYQRYFNRRTITYTLAAVDLLLFFFFGYFYLSEPPLAAPTRREFKEGPEATWRLVWGNDEPLRLFIRAEGRLTLELEEISVAFRDDRNLPATVIKAGNQVVCQAPAVRQSKSVTMSCVAVMIEPTEETVLFLEPAAAFALAELEKIELTLRDRERDKRIKKVSGTLVDERVFFGLEAISFSAAEFVRLVPVFRLTVNGGLLLAKGEYTFTRSVVIPRGLTLTIAPGAKINLVNNASFISYSPITARGTPSEPIVFTGEGDGVGETVVVLDNRGTSIFDFVHFQGGGESSALGRYSSGMLALQGADGIITNSLFADATGDDALNIKYASSTVANNLFRGNRADAIDYDFSRGVIAHNRFLNNGNDAIDTSGSPVLIADNDIEHSGDKCISVGEGSTPVIFNNVLDRCRIGIEVKDRSESIIINNVIINNQIGINAYQKKEIFGGGLGRVYNSIIWDNQEAVAVDRVSQIEVAHSAVAGGYPGENNFDQPPRFTAATGRVFTNSEIDASLNYRRGGDREILETSVGIKVDSAPVGLWEKLAL